MKFTLSWLKDHLDTDASLERIVETLTSLGLEVEGVHDRSKELAAFRIAHVVSAEKHPDADKLRVLVVDTGKEKLQVVCGAPNARAGLKGVFATEGTYIPGSDITLKKGKIRGVESMGMMCSERELKLSEEHNGIIELPDDAPVGTPFAEYAGLNDPVIDVSLTPDRADCAGVRGIARDLAAAGLGTLKPLTAGRLDATPVPGAFKSPFGVAIEAPDACPMYVGRFIRGVRNGPSPKWMQDKLTAIGLRPISTLVDITNYITFDVARPLHAFDADKVKGGIVVRMAREGETLTALNGKAYTLDGAVTVIADHETAEALAGIVGGNDSGCTETTTNLFLEAAIFDTVRVAQTGRRFGIESDARYRLERGVDPAAVVEGVERATRLILDLCGGEASELVIAGSEPEWRRTIALRHGRVLGLGGVDVPADEQHRILEALGFRTRGQEADRTLYEVPSWRADVHGEADLVEEVLRVHGYDAIPATPMEREGTVPKPALTPSQRRAVTAKRSLASRGLFEAVTWSFMSSEVAGPFGPLDPGLRLVNPISADLDVMRPSILPNLIQAAGRNADRGFSDVGLFEVGPAYRDPTPKGQDLVAAGVRAGNAVPRHWAEKAARPVDAYDAKADALAVLEAAGAPTTNLQVTTDAPGWYHPGRSGVLRLGPTVLARFGELHPAVLDTLKVKGPVVGFEVFLDAVPQPKKKGGTAKPLLQLSPFQPVERDFAFVVDVGVEADKIVRAAKGADKALIREVGVFDVYQGAGMVEGKKSVAVSVTLQPTDRTLTEEDIEAIGQKIVAAVAKASGGTLRA